MPRASAQIPRCARDDSAFVRRVHQPATAIALRLIGCSKTPEKSAAQASGVVVSTSDQVSQSRKNAITTAVAKVSPSVVTVQTEAVNQAPQDPFDLLFGRAQPRTSAGLGTGFVVRSDGVIVTNARRCGRHEGVCL